jgi:2-keto-3-deoxy-L-rhamnonate aldolase RhmA
VSTLFTLWTDDVALASAAAGAGVARIGPDLETLGKRARQPQDDNLVSMHDAGSLVALRPVIGPARLHVRTNPVHPRHAVELERLLDAGVTSVMLPMVRSVDEAAAVATQLRGRAELIVMVEHADALPIAETIASIDGVVALYVGANDLARSLGRRTRFSVLGSDLIERVADAAHRHRRSFGFFGIAWPGATTLPVESDLVYAEQVRLGADFIVLARTFGATPDNIASRLDAARARLDAWRQRSSGERAAARAALRHQCAAVDARAATQRRDEPVGVRSGPRRPSR